MANGRTHRQRTRGVRWRISRAFNKYVNKQFAPGFEPIPRRLGWGKLYEALVFGEVLKQLKTKEHFRLTLRGGNTLRLRASGGYIDSKYSRVLVTAQSNPRFRMELWTDIWVTGISYGRIARPIGNPPNNPGDFHETDIILVREGLPDRQKPSYRDVIIAVECKDTKFEKQIYREILGFRREISTSTRRARPTRFVSWPAQAVLSIPPSCFLVYCSDPDICDYVANASVFGIQLFYYRGKRP